MITRQLRLVGFHIVELIKVPFFPTLMIISTITSLSVQALALYAWGGDPWISWVRSGIIGLWTTTTVSAGILGFERFKGTLVHLVNARIHPFAPLTAVVSAAATFGLFSFFVAWIGWGALWMFSSVGWGAPPISMGVFFVTILLLWIACLAVSFVVACVFILSPNAIVYEELLLVPVFIFSGLVFTTSQPPLFISYVGKLIPISSPSSVLLGLVPEGMIIVKLLEGVAVSIVWFIAAMYLGSVGLKKARVAGTLEVI